jgi:hypothetical protein
LIGTLASHLPPPDEDAVISVARLVALALDPAADGADRRAVLEALCREIDIRKAVSAVYGAGWTKTDGARPAEPVVISGVAAALLVDASKDAERGPKYANSVLKLLDRYTAIPHRPQLRAWAWEVLDRREVVRVP